jgi:hypothetical protein
VEILVATPAMAGRLPFRPTNKGRQLANVKELGYRMIQDLVAELILGYQEHLEQLIQGMFARPRR